MKRRQVATGALVLVALLMAVGGASADLSQKSKANRLKATADATGQVEALSLPPGSSTLGSSGAPTVLRPYLSDCRAAAFGSFHFFLNVIRKSSYWQVSEDPSSVISWVRAHPPNGSRLASSGQATTPSGATVRYLTYTVPSDPAGVRQRCLAVAMTSTANGNGTVVGALGQATWVLARPRWAFVPRGVREIIVTHTFDSRTRRATFTDAGRVGWIAEQIDHARVVQPQPFHCPKGQPESYRLLFRAKNGPALADASFSFRTGCAFLALKVGGRSGPLLFLPGRLLHALENIPALQPARAQPPTPPPPR